MKDAGLKTVQNWPKTETASKFGQLSSVAFDVYGNVVVFHRGDRTWNGFTFDRYWYIIEVDINGKVQKIFLTKICSQTLILIRKKFKRLRKIQMIFDKEN